VISGEPLLEFLRGTTLQNLAAVVAKMAPSGHLLRTCIDDACALGLGHVHLHSHCGDLGAEQRRQVRVLALRHVAFAEGSYLLSKEDESTFRPTPSTINLAFQ
jgi:hypothetical protein